jgi:TRAP-type C4-dicarboxylate transport system permease small subunit
MWIPLCTLPIGFVLLALALARDGWRIARGREVTFAVGDKEEALSLAAERDA